MNEWMYTEWMNEWMDKCKNTWMHQWMSGSVGERMNDYKRMSS